MPEEELATADWEEAAMNAAAERRHPGCTGPIPEPRTDLTPEQKAHIEALRSTPEKIVLRNVPERELTEIWEVPDAWLGKSVTVQTLAPKIHDGEFLGLWPDAGMWDQRLPNDDWTKRLDLMAEILGCLAAGVVQAQDYIPAHPASPVQQPSVVLPTHRRSNGPLLERATPLP